MSTDRSTMYEPYSYGGSQMGTRDFDTRVSSTGIGLRTTQHCEQ